MSTKIVIGIFIVMVLTLIPLAVNGMINGDTKTFTLSIICIVLAFLVVVWITSKNKKQKK